MLIYLYLKVMKNFSLIFSIAALFLVSCGGENTNINNTNTSQNNTIETVKKVPNIQYNIIKKIPHDTSLFTEGLFFYNKQLFESTGSPDNIPETKSLIGTVEIPSGKFIKKIEIDRTKYFGEGAIILNNNLYQLTYKNKTGFIYNASNFEAKGQFSYLSNEGWGLTTNGKDLIMSDGTNIITFLNPQTFTITKTIDVNEFNVAIDYVNELEYVNGFIYANIYMKNEIVKIDAESGNVVGRLNLTPLLQEAQKRYPYSLETNGIAFNPETNTFLVTGKMWPYYFEIALLN